MIQPQHPQVPRESPRQNALNLLRQAAGLHDNRAQMLTDAASNVTVRENGTNVTLESPLRAEHFTVVSQGEQVLLCGQGGTFELNSFENAALACATVLDTWPLHKGGTLDLQRHLLKHGFTLHIGQRHEFNEFETVSPLSATHEDGRVLWFNVTDTGYGDVHVCHGPLTLGLHLSHYNPEIARIMALENHEIKEEFLASVPERLTPRRWNVQAQSIAAVVRHARTRPGTPILQKRVWVESPRIYPWDAEPRPPEGGVVDA